MSYRTYVPKRIEIVKTRLQKEKEIEVLHREFEESPNALLVGFQGIKVGADERLRRELRQANVSYRVVKNTLAIRAAETGDIARQTQAEIVIKHAPTRANHSFRIWRPREAEARRKVGKVRKAIKLIICQTTKRVAI